MKMKPKYHYRGRLKIHGRPAIYHCMSRIVGGEPLLKARDKEGFRKMIRKQAIFCGVELLTYAIMNNHFHVLVRVTPQDDLEDDVLVDRVRCLYGKSEAVATRNILSSEKDGPSLRKSLVARMGDVSVFLKELKQRFSIWYNKTHDRFGTLWAERFKSVLVQGRDHALVTVAAYIDLNAVRAGFCSDPKDYRFCGYAEAIAGNTEARRGFSIITSQNDWWQAQKDYRVLLFGKGAAAPTGKGRVGEKALKSILQNKGEIDSATLLRCRLRYISDGMALGTADFIETLFKEVRARYWKKRRTGPVPVAGDEKTNLFTLNRMRGPKMG